MGAGVGESPEARRAGVGRCLATAQQAQSRGRPANGRGRPSPGPAAGGDGARRADRPRDGEPPTRHAAQPARRDRRTHNVRSPQAGGERKAVVAGATGEGAWGGVGVGARGAPPLPHPTSRDVAGRVRAGRGTQHTPPPGDDATDPAGEEWRARSGAGGAGRGGKAEESRLSQTRPPSSGTPPQQPSRAPPRPQAPGKGHPPDPTTRGGGAFQAWGGCLSLSPLFSLPIPRRTGGGEAREPGGARRGHRAALGTDHVNNPSAGSPTETLLRLLLPLDSQVRPSSQRSARAVGRPRRGRSEGLTKPSNR